MLYDKFYGSTKRARVQKLENNFKNEATFAPITNFGRHDSSEVFLSNF